MAFSTSLRIFGWDEALTTPFTLSTAGTNVAAIIELSLLPFYALSPSYHIVDEKRTNNVDLATSTLGLHTKSAPCCQTSRPNPQVPLSHLRRL